MYSNELMSYLYSYNLPQKSKEDDLEDKKAKDNEVMLNTFKKFSKICVTVPVDFRHGQG